MRFWHWIVRRREEDRELEEELASRGVERLADVIGLAHESPQRRGRNRGSGMAG